MKKVALALSLLISTTIAQAAVYTIDQPAFSADIVANRDGGMSLPTFLQNLNSNTFNSEDTFNFYLSESDSVSFNIIANTNILEYKTKEISYELLNYANDVIDQGTVDAGNGSFLVSSYLGTGSYSMKLTSVASGFLGGKYNLSFYSPNATAIPEVTSPVPETGTFAMMAIGLISVISIAYKRTSKQSKA